LSWFREKDKTAGADLGLTAAPTRRDLMNRKEAISAPQSELNALLGRGSEFEGKLIFEGTVRLDGKFRGQIHSEGKLLVGEHGDLEGEIWVESAIISGKVKGNINAKGKLELHSGARVEGTIITPVLVVQEGAMFDGQCQMSKQANPAQASVDSSLLESKPSIS
jgi:cytoskeletal protein CcmA (bactofilin family)